jgi:hypothetical protein
MIVVRFRCAFSRVLPFYKEELDLYVPRLEEVINMMLEIELPLLRGLDLAYVHKIKQLLLIISNRYLLSLM